MKTFAERLLETREARGFGVNQLAEISGVDAGGITRSEKRDRRSSIEAETLSKLATGLGVTMDWLWKGVGNDDATDLLAATFFMAVERCKLREAIERDPGRWKLSTLAKAVQLKLPTDAHGVPVGGWPKLLDEIQAQGAMQAPPVIYPSKRKPSRIARPRG